ncbi:MAG TPA: hypothetical protein VMX13_02045 [Sedimentisphaerales bacterium]|nr:hypothetical protein [Sedimentisphaerales bacterium]
METFFAALIGAFVSLLAVYLTLRHNQKVHEHNLREERTKRREEREFRAKQESLILASEAFTRFLTYFISMPDRQLPQDGSVAPEVTELGVALNKLHFYSSLNMIEKSTHLGQILDEVFSDTMKAKMPSAFIFEEIKAIDIEISGLEKSNAVLLEEIRALLFSDPQSPIIASHRTQLAQNFQRISECHGRKVDLFRKKYHETENCRDVVAKHLKNIYEASRDVLLLAREELGFPIDGIRYRKIMDDRIESMEKNLKELFAQIRSEVEKKMK